jgi:alpha-N-acetylglucosamine transferase
MVSRNLPVPHRFVCLSNVNVPCERIPLTHNWPGWWSKLELFRPGIFKGRVLYIDLDSIIIGDLSPLVDYPGAFVIGGKQKAIRKRGKDGIEIAKYKSAVMCFDAGAGERLYKEFTPDVMKMYRSDQDWIAHIFPSLHLFPKGWLIKLKHCPEGPPESAKIVFCMPDKNNRAVRKYEWVRKIWR